ncbi:uncharacterized protein HMPREF1541_09001 [Cyphellophora europaea CBS 101466]|uniref:Uncharacterized protein n=1 Tax=Cyphellophora europaea (strain CBS 101466) TaxID=1220924 RepID=W2RLZ0_CYPE1|nr:uncharacterized protein HMPREF1541_09001 [Cyphellophora europaea CBS 101466]ETN36723.1 hypothetical protein HMPREF1541_09001 [Cyphellophora europaea CBS 101466]
MDDDDATPRKVSDAVSVNSTEPKYLAVTYPGTVETKFEITLLAAYCGSFPLRSESEAREEYSRVFNIGEAFTIIQREETALEAPMKWTETGMDETETFNIFTAATDNLYRVYKTSHVKYSGRSFEFLLSTMILEPRLQPRP